MVKITHTQPILFNSAPLSIGPCYLRSSITLIDLMLDIGCVQPLEQLSNYKASTPQEFITNIPLLFSHAVMRLIPADHAHLLKPLTNFSSIMVNGTISPITTLMQLSTHNNPNSRATIFKTEPTSPSGLMWAHSWICISMKSMSQLIAQFGPSLPSNQILFTL